MFLITIQAGGKSSRMGQDKGLVPFLGQPLVQRLLERVRGLTKDVVVITNHPKEYRFLGVPLFVDRLPGRGALGGLYTALSAAQQLGAQAVGVIACDMPFASPAILEASCHILQETGVNAVIPRSDQGIEPFHAVYCPSACLPLVEAALRADQWRVDSWFSRAHIHFIPTEETLKYDPSKLAFYNVNTMQELKQAESLAMKMDGFSDPNR